MGPLTGPIGDGSMRRRDPRHERPIADDVDAVDRTAADGFDGEPASAAGRDHRTGEPRLAQRHAEMRAIAGQRRCPPLPERLPEVVPAAARRHEAGAAVAVGARIAAVMVGIADEAENVAEREPVPMRAAAVARSHGVQIGPSRLAGLRDTVHRNDLDHGRQAGQEARPVDAASAQPIARMMGKGHEGTRGRLLEGGEQREAGDSAITGSRGSRSR
jgi:hypothetical protein